MFADRYGVFLLATLALAASGCDGGGADDDDDDDDDDDGSSVMATARFVKGPTGGSAFAPGFAQSAPDGRWTLTPDSMRAEIFKLELFPVGGGGVPQGFGDMVGCNPVVDASDATLSEVLTCDVLIPVGSYAGFGFQFSTTFDLLVNDATNGIFTDSAAAGGLSSVAPGGGAETVSYTIPGFGDPPALGLQQFFGEPWVVSSEGTAANLTLTVISDTVHTVYSNFSGGAGTIDDTGSNPGMLLVPSPGGAGRIELYSADTSSAANATLPSPTSQDLGSVRLYFANPALPAQPSYVFFTSGAGPAGSWSADPASAPDTGNDSRAGGYLGVDGTGTACWATPTDYTWATYSHVCRMALVATAGGTTVVECDQTTTAPVPVSGSTYASGCPAITPDFSYNLTLIAK